MSADPQDFRSRLAVHAEELIGALAHSEKMILSTIERECEALRTRRMLAARSLQNRLCEATKLYLSCARAARASIDTLEGVLPGCREYLEQRRAAFAPVLQIELAVLGAQRAAAEAAIAEQAYGESRAGRPARGDPPIVQVRKCTENSAPGQIGSKLRLPASPSAPPRRRVG